MNPLKLRNINIFHVWQLKSMDVICIDTKMMRYDGKPALCCWSHEDDT